MDLPSDITEKPKGLKEKLFSGSRRRFIMGAAFAAVAFAAMGGVADAFLPVGPTGGGGAAVLQATYTLNNTSGSSQAANLSAPSFGVPFLPGQVTSGTYPQCKVISGGAQIPITVYFEIFYSDGSLQWCGIKPLIPASVAGSGTLAIGVYNNGTAPTASGLSYSNLSAGGASLAVSITGQRNLTGTYISPLNDGLTNTNQSFAGASPDIVVYGDGAAGKLVRVRSSFAQSGTPHGQLECYWYVWLLADATGAYYGAEFLPMPCQPWYNNDSPAKAHRVLNAISLNNGASVLTDFFATGSFGTSNDTTFVWNGDTGNPYNLTLANGWSTSSFSVNRYVEFTTTGTLPSGLSLATGYWVSSPTGNTMPIDINACSGITPTITSLGSGTHTMTSYPYLAHFGAEYLSQSNGRMQFFQGAGTTSGVGAYRWTFNSVYWRSTKVIPPYNLTGQTINSPYSVIGTKQFNGNPAPVHASIPDTGERPDLGLRPSYTCNFYWSQAALDEQNFRVVGLMGGTNINQLRDTTTKSIPNLWKADLTGMPTHNLGFQWLGGYPAVAAGFTAPPSGNNTATFQIFTDSTTHRPAFAMDALLITAEPQFMDIVTMMGGAALWSNDTSTGTASYSVQSNPLNGQRGSTIGGVFYPMLIGSSLRDMAWNNRDLGNAAWACQGNPENASYKTCFSDYSNSTYAGLLAYNAGASSFWNTNGMCNFAGGNLDVPPWMSWYEMEVAPYLIGLNGGTNATNINTANLTSYCTYRCKYPAFINATFGNTWECGSYSNFQPSNISNVNQTGFSMEVGIYSWENTSSPYFTWNGTGQGNYTLTAHDGIVFWSPFGGGVPGGLTGEIAYLFRDIAGDNFNVEVSSGSGALAPSDSQSSIISYLAPYHGSPSTGCMQGTTQDTQGYYTTYFAAASVMIANGIPFDSATLTDTNTRMTGFDVQNQSDPRNYMQQSY